MTASETFKDFVIKQMEAAGYTLLSNGEFQTTSEAVILSFWVPGHNEWVLNVIASGRELRMNENAIEAFAERKMRDAIRLLESSEPVVAAAAKARATL